MADQDGVQHRVRSRGQTAVSELSFAFPSGEQYQQRAERRRPHNLEQFARAVHDLARQGCTPADIGAALRLAPGAVRALLAQQGVKP